MAYQCKYTSYINFMIVIPFYTDFIYQIRQMAKSNINEITVLSYAFALNTVLCDQPLHESHDYINCV